MTLDPGVVGFSSISFGRSTNWRRRYGFLRAHRRALEHFSGVPRTIAYDNLKTVVPRRNGRYGPEPRPGSRCRAGRGVL